MNEAMPPAPRSCRCRCFCHCAGDAPCTPHLTAARGCRKPAQRLHHSPDSGALSLTAPAPLRLRSGQPPGPPQLSAGSRLHNGRPAAYGKMQGKSKS